MHGDLIAAADAMRSLLQERAEELAGCIEGSPEEAALARLADALDAYDKARHELAPNAAR